MWKHCNHALSYKHKIKILYFSITLQTGEEHFHTNTKLKYTSPLHFIPKFFSWTSPYSKNTHMKLVKNSVSWYTKERILLQNIFENYRADTRRWVFFLREKIKRLITRPRRKGISWGRKSTQRISWSLATDLMRCYWGTWAKPLVLPPRLPACLPCSHRSY